MACSQNLLLVGERSFDCEFRQLTPPTTALTEYWERHSAINESETVTTRKRSIEERVEREHDILPFPIRSNWHVLLIYRIDSRITALLPLTFLEGSFLLTSPLVGWIPWSTVHHEERPALTRCDVTRGRGRGYEAEKTAAAGALPLPTMRGEEQPRGTSGQAAMMERRRTTTTRFERTT